MIKIIKIITLIIFSISLSIPQASASGFEKNPKFIVNGKTIPKKDGVPFSKDGYAYLPFVAVEKAIGSTVTWDKKKKVATSTTKNYKVKVTYGKGMAELDDDTVPFAYHMYYTTAIFDDVRPIMKNGIMYVAADLFEAEYGWGLNHKLVVSTDVYEKDINKKYTLTMTKGADKPKPIKWVAPKIKSKWTTNPDKNFKILEKELKFKSGRFGIKGKSHAIVIHDRPKNSGTDVMIAFYMWDADGEIKEGYQIPIVSKELFKFYFDKNYKKVFNYFDKGDIPNHAKIGNREIQAEINDASGALFFYISKPNKKLAKNDRH